MKSATFSELRNNARKYFDAVERGESIQVYRHGKLIALVIPPNPKARGRWKHAAPLALGGEALSAAILAERRG